SAAFVLTRVGRRHHPSEKIAPRAKNPRKIFLDCQALAEKSQEILTLPSPAFSITLTLLISPTHSARTPYRQHDPPLDNSLFMEEQIFFARPTQRSSRRKEALNAPAAAITRQISTFFPKLRSNNELSD